MSVIQRVFPFLAWAGELNADTVRRDLIAGVTVALVLVPQSMAYAQLAGLPAYYGLYAAFLPPMIANLFGSSRQLATGPVAVVSLMTAATLEPLATAGSQQFVAYAVLLALLVGGFQLLLGVARLGLVVNFLSHPVVNGFTNAAAIIIATSQLDKIFGVQVEKAEHNYQTVIRIVTAALHWTHLPTLGMAALAFAVMVGLRRVNPRMPNVLVAVVLTTAISWAVGYQHDAKVPVEEVVAPSLADDVQRFNLTLAEQRRMEELRSEGNRTFATVSASSAEFCQRCHPARDVAMFRSSGGSRDAGLMDRALALHQMAGLLDRHISQLKEEVSEGRQGLRDLAFARVEAADGSSRFYERSLLPEGAVTDGRRWRLRVSTKPLDPAALTIVGGGAVVGAIPRGLPSPKLPHFDMTVLPKLIAPAIIISLLGFMEAISIAKAMAAKTRQRLDPDQELIGQGLANLVGCAFQSYAVSGSFSRSAVNLQAGARTGLSNVFSSGVVVVVLLFLSPTLYYLPQAVLAAVIMMAVIGLLNVSGFVHAWQTKPFDGMVSVITFVATLGFAPHLEWGIFLGVALSLGGYLFRSMRPHVARLTPGPGGVLRDAARHGLGTCRYMAVVAFDGPLNFASTSYLEDEILARVAEQKELRTLLVSGQGITEIDASGEEELRHLVERLRAVNIQVAFADLSDKVIDVLHRSHLYEVIGEENIFATDVRAIAALYAPAHREGAEPDCPFLGVVPRLTELSLHPDGSLRDATRHRLPRCRHIAALRIESPVNRGSVRYVEEWVLERIADRPDLRHVLFVTNGMTELDDAGAGRLAGLVTTLRSRGLGVSFSGVPEAVVDTLERTGAMEVIGHGSLYPTQAVAVASTWGSVHVGSEETACPLRPLAPHLTELALHPQGTLRDASRYGLNLCRHVAVLRFDGPLSFASGAAMTTEFDRWRLDRSTVGTVVFVGSALTGLDSRQAGNMLEFIRHVRSCSTRAVICSLPDHVFEVLARTGVADAIGVEDIYPSENGALAAVWGSAHDGSDEDPCPLKPLLPHVTELSLHPDGSLRDARRHGLDRCRHIAVVRFDGRLDYSTVDTFQRGIMEVVEGRPGIGFLLIAGHTLEDIDAIAAEELVELLDRLRRRGLHVCVSGLRDQVLDALVETGVRRAIGEECLFPTQARALERIYPEAHNGSGETNCPLRGIVARDDGSSPPGESPSPRS
jgi:sulfate permease, SulP family